MTGPTDTEALVDLLCTRIGMIMEDASVLAILSSGDRPRQVADVRRAVDRIQTPIAAAEAITGD